MGLFYLLLVRLFVKFKPKKFIDGIAPAQLLAFSTSSSAATLPVTMERVEEHLGVDEEVASFVLPIGATINMDGTSLYQAVAAVFIAQAFGMDLSVGTQLGIILTATLASIGAAAVPGAGMVMLVIVLGQAGIPEAGLALIFAIDRPLDMCRTVVNITGDASVSMMVAKSVGKLHQRPKEKKWDDHYPKK
jgi:proton glutamate symport protein